MNRKPQPADSWWSSHQATCNGTFEKISEESGDKVKKDEPELSRNNKFKGKGRTWSEIHPNTTKMTEFFKKKTLPAEQASQKLKCVNCTKFETESLRELNDHLDDCLIKLSPKKEKIVFNLVNQDL